MLFYKIVLSAPNQKLTENLTDRRAKVQQARQIAHDTEEFNRMQKNSAYWFVSDILSNEVIGGMIDPGLGSKPKRVSNFFKALGITGGEPHMTETTFSAMQALLGRASREDYIENDDDILELFGLDRITDGFHRRGTDFEETILGEVKSEEELLMNAEKRLSRDTLAPELRRICSGKNASGTFGHPVHYMVETDDDATCKAYCESLLQALYSKGRLKSRRYCTVRFASEQDRSESVYHALYDSCEGGTVVVRYRANSDCEEGPYANGNLEIMDMLCRTLLHHRNTVLTVLCLPRVCEKQKREIFERLGNTGIVEIKEDLADESRSIEYLKGLAAANRIRADKKLYSRLESDKKYLPGELRTMFDEWYNNKLRTSVFPEYKEITVCRKEAVKEKAQGSAYQELQEMIGLTEAKSVIQKALDYYKVQRIYREKGIKQDTPAMHMVFTGNPGTAKTTVARLFARIMKENGLLSKGHLVEVGRADLVGKYVGWTAQLVKEKFRAAKGGVLFIDEAYSLVEERGGLYGDEAINTIVQEMENHREDMVVIFAGYPEKMEHFLEKNPGLRSRIAFHVSFPDYSAEELCGIARLIGKSKGVTLTESALQKLSLIFEEARKQSDFGNGRFVRNLIEQSKMNQAGRILNLDPDQITERELTSIRAEDIEIPATKPETKIRKIGFGA